MSKLKRARTFAKKATALVTVFGMAASLIPAVPMQAKAADFTGQLTEVKSVEVDKDNNNIVWVTFNDNIKGKLTFLEDGIFRYNVDPSGEFSKYAAPNSSSHKGIIQQYPDESEKYSHPEAAVTSDNSSYTVKSGDVSIIFDKSTAKMTVKEKNETVMEEEAALSISAGSTIQTIKKQNGENFYGGGTQNGRFVHTGEAISIANGGWTDGGVASPSPFYYTTGGYGVLRNTFKPGRYDFGRSNTEAITTLHNEEEYDAYYFVTEPGNGRNLTQEILQDYYKVTGNPILLPEYGFYAGHLNAYNRDAWSDTQTAGSKAWSFKGTDPAGGAGGWTRYESGMSAEFILRDGMEAESLNGEVPTVLTDNFPDATCPYKWSARALIDEYRDYDMPLGYFLPNDGYGTGYGKNGYRMTGGVNADGSSSKERIDAIDANIENLRLFAEYAASKGVAAGLWTQSYLVPDSNPNTYWHILRDFEKEVGAGVTTLKTDVAWVGAGYSMQLDGVKSSYDIASRVSGVRPNLISVCGWAGSHRYNGVWTGDQSGGNWEYIRFHIPTYIGTSLSGNPNIGSDIDGIHGGGSPIILSRDYQWKTFSSIMMIMDGWGSTAKMPYTFGDPYTGINRMYLKLKSKLMPYLYTSAFSASNMDTGNNDTGLPMIRAMFLEYPDEAYAYSKNMQYQYMFGKNMLVAPVYQDTDADDEGNDVRDNIFLPDENEIWIDFFTGQQYRGGQNLNRYDAPIWKLPLFVKNGAIIPQYEANNTPDEINKANRIVEFWPAGNTDYTAVEDDGKFIEYNEETDSEYGVLEDISYGTHVTTKYTSKVNGTTATLTAEKSSGSYDGYEKNKNTTFVVHVSKKPAGITASNGGQALQATEVTSKDAFDKAAAAAGTAVWFYDAAPEIETYASDKETAFKAMVADVKVAPKLYVKFAPADAQTANQTLVIDGFENKGEFPADVENKELEVPVLTEDEGAKTATSVSVNWTEVEGADSYELLIDGVLNSMGTALSYTHADLAFASSHTYRVRARNEKGYSAWSEEHTFTSDADPWKDTPEPVSITWPGTIYSDRTADKAFDRIFQPGDGGFHSGGNDLGVPLTVEYDKAYKLDKVEYYPRDDGGNGTVKKMKLETSLDGVHWKEEGTYEWQASGATKTMDLNTAARFIRFTALASVGNFFSASEIKVYAEANSKGFVVGSTLFNEEMKDADYVNLKNYLGTSPKDGSNFVDQVQKCYGDINVNNYYDVYDYAYTTFQLDGGTKKTGSVAGTSAVDVSAQQVAEGEEFTVTFRVSNAANVNALGQIITYDSTKAEYVSLESASAISQMENLCVNKTYNDGSAYVNIAFANRGDKDLYNGSDTLVTLTMKAKEAISTSDKEVIDLHALILIGPDYSTNGEIGEDPKNDDPSIPNDPEKYVQDDFTITITNEKLPEDDGTNVERLINQKNFNGLFDGNIERDFEFLYNIETNWDETGKLPEYVTLPVTMNFAFKNPSTMSKLVLHNANKANGFVTSVKAKANYEDGTSSEEKTIALTEEQSVDNAAFTFEEIFTAGKNVASVDVTVLSAISSKGEETAIMMTLAEIEMFEGKADVPLPAEKYAQDELDIAITNEALPEDDGTNVETLIQSNSFDGLFDGKIARDFELKWEVTEEVKLPLTLHFTPKETGTMSKLIVHNANKANGFVTQVSAKVTYVDGTSAEGTNELAAEQQVDNAAFTFDDLFNPNKAVQSLDVTILKALDRDNDFAETDEMMTLAEIELFKGGEPGDDVEPPIGPNDPDPANPLNPGKIYAQDDFDLTITNDEMPTDDGSNVATLINQGSFDGLFDGSIGRDFELLWNIEGNWVDGKLPSYIKVPFTIHLGMKKPGPVSQIAVYNANRANGYVTAIQAKVNYTDGTSTIERIRKFDGDDYTQYPDNHAFVLKYADSKDVASIDVTVLRAIVGNSGEETKNMATLAELEVYGVFSNQALLEKIEEYRGVTNPDELYTSATWDKFQTEREKLNDLTESKDQAAVDKAIADADKAFKALKTNRSELETEYNKRKDLTNEDGRFTKDSFDKFQSALNEAKKLLDNEASTGAACKAAKEVLADAFQALVQLNRNDLLAKISEYEALTNEDGTFTAASWEAFQKAIKDARDVLENKEATQEQIDAAVPALTAAFEALVLNRTIAEEEIKKYDTIQNTNNTYTAESWNAFQAALKHAKDILADQNATPAAINETQAALQKAFQALQKADNTVQPPAPADELKKGDKVVAGGVQYKVLNASKKTVAAAKLNSKNAKNVTIKNTVKIKGVTCKVTEISTGAFKNAKKLESVTIGKNVKTIGKNAFNGSTKLKKVTFKGTSVPAIKNGAFKKTKSGMTVKVPKGMKKAKRSQLSKKMASTGAKKLKLK